MKLKLSSYYGKLTAKSHITSEILTLVENSRTIFQQVRNRLSPGRQLAENLVEQLRQSELLYRAFSELTSDYAFSFLIASDGQLIAEWESETLARVTGYTLAELLAPGGLLKLLHPDDLSLGCEQLRKILSGQTEVIERRIITKAGEVRWFRHYAKPEWDNQQQRVVRILMAGQDITRLKQVEAELQEQRDFANQIMSAMGHGNGELAGGIAVITDITEQKRTEQLIRQQNQFLEALHETSLEMLNHLELDDLLQNILVRVGALVGTQYAYIYLVNRQADLPELELILSLTELSKKPGLRLKYGESISGKVWQTGQTIIVNDYQHFSGRIAAFENEPYHAVACLPLKSGSEISGVLGVNYAEAGRIFTQEEVALLERFARLASVALDNAQLYTSAQRRLSELNTLQRVAQAVNSNLQLDQFFQIVVEQVSMAFDYNMVSIYLCSEAGLTLQACVGYDKVINFIRFDQGISGRVVRTGEAAFIGDASQDAAFLEATPGIQQNIIVPLKSKQNLVIGTLSVESQGEPILTEADFRLLKLLADQVSIGVENAQLFNEAAIARDQALEVARLKSQFLANVSHEIRTPLSSVIGVTELLLDTVLDPEQHDFATTIRYSAELLLNLINDILDSSKIEANKLTLEALDFDLTTLVKETVGLVRPSALEKGLVLLSFVDAALKSRVIGDPTRLRQVLLNLLSNAIKFTNRGEVTLQVKVEKLTEQGVHLQFEIRDSGIGMSPDTIARIFQPFTQADNSTTRRYGGTGLGLSITQQLIQLMGGTVVVESEEGNGSIFSFSLALDYDCADAAPYELEVSNPFSNKVSSSETTYNLPDYYLLPAQSQFLAPKSWFVLLVEDNPVNQKLVRLQLQKLGCKVDVANNGREAIQAISQRVYDLVLMDVQMPEMDGLKATSTIRQNEASTAQHILIVAMTASAISGDKERCLEAGMDDYLSKPIVLEHLQALLRRWLRPSEPRPGALPSVSEADPNEAALNVMLDVPFETIKEFKPSDYDIVDDEVIASLRQLQSSDSEGILTQVIGFFLEDSQKWLTELHQAVATHNLKELRQVTHTLKGSSANLGAKAFPLLCAELENLARAENFVEVNVLLPKLEVAYLELRQALQAEQGDYAKMGEVF